MSPIFVASFVLTLLLDSESDCLSLFQRFLLRISPIIGEHFTIKSEPETTTSEINHEGFKVLQDRLKTLEVEVRLSFICSGLSPNLVKER